MSEMSLLQQIKQLENMIDYIKLVRSEAEGLNKYMSDSVSFLRQNGLRTETADKIQQVKMGHINAVIGPMLEEMMKRDYRYLEEVKNNLENAINR